MNFQQLQFAQIVVLVARPAPGGVKQRRPGGRDSVAGASQIGGMPIDLRHCHVLE